MDKSYEFFLAIHLYTLYASGFLMIFYLALTQGNFKTEFDFIRRIRIFLPVYYLFLALILFTGVLLLALNHFAMSVNFLLMIVAWFLIFALAIFHFILFKKARRARRYNTFRWMSIVVLLLELALLLTPFYLKF